MHLDCDNNKNWLSLSKKGLELNPTLPQPCMTLVMLKFNLGVLMEKPDVILAGRPHLTKQPPGINHVA